MHTKQNIPVTKRGGFTMAVVVIVSLIMFAILAFAAQLLTQSSASLQTMYYQQQAREAAESGAVLAATCVKRDTLTLAVTITPKTNCYGTSVSTQNLYLVQDSRFRTTYSLVFAKNGAMTAANITGKTEVLRKSDGAVIASYPYNLKQNISHEVDVTGARATKRWWYFGSNVKLDFKASGSSTPVATTTTGAAASVVKHEGTTVITDRQGELLFYSDGLTIWDKTGAVMSNSSGLKGSLTATQSVVAFPLNKAETLYVVVSNSVNANGVSTHGELYYSVVDLSANGGLGAVLVGAKNIQMGGTKYSSEALAAMPNLANDGYWVYTYTPNPTNNRIWAFEVKEKPKTDSTYAQNPVQFSPSGGLTAYDINAKDATYRARICTGSPPSMVATTVETGFGSMSFNDDYSKLLVYMGGEGCTDSYGNAGTLHLLSVNRQTGVLSKHASWFPPSVVKNTYRSKGYSADFSPSERYVYVSEIYPGALYRYDISSGNSTTIANSKRLIGQTHCTAYLKSQLSYNNGSSRTDACVIDVNVIGAGIDGGGQVRRGPDGKMYVADRGAQHLSVIDKPDAPNGTTDAATAANVGWRYAGLPLPSGTLSYYGLPQMVTPYSPRFLQY